MKQGRGSRGRPRIAAIRELGDSIFHVDDKDTQLYGRNLPKTGVLDTKRYTDERNRAWIFPHLRVRARRGIVVGIHLPLRMFGYDYVLSVEYEDSPMSPEEGLTNAVRFLDGLVIKEKAAAAWWV